MSKIAISFPSTDEVLVDDDIIEFYSLIQYFDFSYGWNENLSKTQRKEIKEKNSAHRVDIYSDINSPLGAIKIQPVSKVFTKEDFFHFRKEDIKQVNFDNRMLPLNKLSAALKPFDLYSEFATAAFYIANEEMPKVMVLDNYYDDWYNSRFSDFETYLDFVVQTKGFVNSRKHAYYDPQGHNREMVDIDYLLFKTGAISLDQFY